MRILRVLVLTFCLIPWLLPAQEGFDCFSVLAGKNATADGSVIFAHNEDDWGDRIVNWYKVPARSHEKSEVIKLKNGGKLQQVSRTYSYLWLEMPEMDFSDSYMNEWGVTIGSDACLSREDKPDLTSGGIGYWLRRAMAERSKTARQAVKVGGALVEKFGYASSGRTYCIADGTEAWMLSVVNGKHWVAERIPDDDIAIIPNYYTITTVNLDDTMNFYGSTDLVDYARRRKWYDSAKDGEFNFRLAYSDPGNLKNRGNIVRHWSAANLIYGKDFSIEEAIPFSLKPVKQVELTDLFRVLRNHNEGTEYDGSEKYTKGNPHEFGRTICSATTQYGFVAQLRNNLPKDVAFVMWLSPFRPCVHAFTPWYSSITKIPAGFSGETWSNALETHFEPVGDLNKKAPDNNFLKFVEHAKLIDDDYSNRIDEIRKEIALFEGQLLRAQDVLESGLRNSPLSDSAPDETPINDYTAQQVRHSLEMIR